MKTGDRIRELAEMGLTIEQIAKVFDTFDITIGVTPADAVTGRDRQKESNRNRQRRYRENQKMARAVASVTQDVTNNGDVTRDSAPPSPPSPSPPRDINQPPLTPPATPPSTSLRSVPDARADADLLGEPSSAPSARAKRKLKSAFSEAEISAFARDCYTAYPKHVEPRDFEKEFAKLVRQGDDPLRMIAAAQAFAEATQRAGTEKRFIASPARWLRKGGHLSVDLPEAENCARAGPTRMVEKTTFFGELFRATRNDPAAPSEDFPGPHTASEPADTGAVRIDVASVLGLGAGEGVEQIPDRGVEIIPPDKAHARR